MPTTAESRSRSLEPGALITLYDLDLSPKGGPVLHFHDSAATGTNQISFGGKTYTPYPIEATDFEWNTQGTLPRPKLTVSNIGSTVSALLRQYGDFVGCVLTRTRTFSAFVSGGGESNAAQHFPIEKFMVERKVSENSSVCTFELSMHMDAEGVTLPRRQILAHTCIWMYRGPECGYTGAPKTNRLGQQFGVGGVPPATINRGLYNASTVYNKSDYVYTLVNGVQIYWVKVGNAGTQPLVDDGSAWWMDTCVKKLTDCKLHFGALAVLPYGGFPGAHKVQ